MDNIKIPKNFSLEKFVDVYISESFKIGSKEISSDTLDKRIRKRVSKSLGIDEKIVLGLHHAFHWTLFIEEYHPFEYIQSTRPNQIVKVKLKRIYKKEEIESYKKLILKNYKDYLIARINNLDKIVNNPPQQA